MSKMKLFFMFVIFSVFSGCYMPSGLEPYYAVSPDKKDSMLKERLAKYNRAVYWGASGELSNYIDTSVKKKVLDEESKRRQHERLVSSDITDVTYPEGNDYTEADVKMQIKYFDDKTYTVFTREESQKWKFDRFNGGWLMSGRESLAQDSTANSGDATSRARMKK